ncbi:MAG TPA: HNH endonuclease signature motif containing protein [Mycobacterium sp.]|nr:HNH endonuclease signature motif containing protein [Mycobacterium sp.]
MEEVAGLAAAVDAVAGLDWAAMPVADRLTVLAELEVSARRLRAVSGAVMASLAAEPSEALGHLKPANLIADTLRVSPAEARERLRVAGLVAERVALSGAPMPPLLVRTAKHVHDGTLHAAHVVVIANFLGALPEHVPVDAREWAEGFLADKACELRPDQVAKLADRIAVNLNPDGHFSEVDRARKRGIVIGRQHPDGMSPIFGWLTPQLRATLDAVLGKLAVPGQCNPDDETPHVDGEPSEGAERRDVRTAPQRTHNGMLAMCRAVLASGELGSHHGLPVTVIVSTTLKELQTGAGMAVTGSGTLLPMPEVIRMAAHAYHYLAVFDEHRSEPLYLGRSKRLASVGQRIVLHSRDRGCTFPGCSVPGYLCEADHIEDYRHSRRTDIDDLHFCCKAHHKLKTSGGWTVRKHPDGRIHWHPPPQLDLPGGTNDYHHPQRLLPDQERPLPDRE